MSASSTPLDVINGLAEFSVVCGDATEALRSLPDGFAAVTYCDPSYGLSQQSTEDVIACLRAWLDGKPYVHNKSGFMQAKWDSWVAGPEAWKEVHRCLRPGGYCVAFSSTRTVDLLGIAVRLAGFEIRPGLAWAFGSGFPKSLDVSRSIDSSWGMEREVVAPNPNARPNRVGTLSPSMNSQSEGLPITVPSHPAAVQWDGYGTDVKPAFEPLIVARKALDGTVAHNVQTHGCGALNIDAARIGSESTQRSVNIHGVLQLNGVNHRPYHDAAPVHRTNGSTLGRFPAALALVHDEGCVCEGTRRVLGDARTGGGERPGGFGDVGSESGNGRPCAPGHADPDGMESIDAWTCTATCAVAELGRQSGESESTSNVRRNSGRPESVAKGAEYNRVGYGHADAGTAARFFYQAKASSSDRLAYITCTAGCAHHDSVAFQKDARDSARDPSREQPHGLCRACNGVRTHHQHSTVKPLDLAKYHARLLSLPAHTKPIALVPFCGSGVEARALLDVGFRVIAIDQDYRYCAMTEFRLSHKEPDCDVAKRDALVESERGDWTKPIRTSKSTDPIAVGKQLPLFGKKD